MRRVVAGLLLALFLGACDADPDPVARVQKATDAEGRAYVIDELFTHAGVTVYRFVDGGRYRYFAVRDGEPVAVLSHHVVSTGKTVVTWDDTVMVPE